MQDTLEKKRLEGDDLADGIISEIVRIEGEDELKRLRDFLTNTHNLNYLTQSAPIIDFIESLRCDMDRKFLLQNVSFYNTYQEKIGLILACYSLPYCFLAEDGARVLWFSQRMRHNTLYRLLETGDFISALFNKRAWETREALIRIAKVRLLHALSRHYCLTKTKWDMSWGYPINQEDMVGTNLAFSWIVLKGLQKLGIEVNDKSKENYLLFWDKIGNLLGIDTSLSVSTLAHAKTMDNLIAIRQFRPSEVGQQLCKVLLDSLEKFQPNSLLKGLPTAQTRFFLGDTYADWLAIPPNSSIQHNLLRFQSRLNTIWR